MIKITKKLLTSFAICRGNKASHLRCNKEWLTNGHWLIRRDKIKMTPQAEMLFDFTLPDEHVNPMIDRSEKAKKKIKYVGADFDCSGIAVHIFEFTNGEKVNFFHEYIKMAGVKELQGTKVESPWFAFDEEGKMWFVITARRT